MGKVTLKKRPKSVRAIGITPPCLQVDYAGNAQKLLPGQCGDDARRDRDR
jgi:hypothetical protein